MHTQAKLSPETLSRLAKGAELASNEHLLANLDQIDWKLWPERSPSNVVRHKLFLLDGEGLPNRDHLHAQILYAVQSWLMDSANEHRRSFEIAVYEASERLFDRGRDVSKWPDDADIDEVLRRAGTGISASGFSVTIFEIDVLWLQSGLTYPQHLEEFARVLTNAIYEKYAGLTFA